jgi:acetyl esterase
VQVGSSSDPLGLQEMPVPLDPALASVLQMMADNDAPPMSHGTPQQAREGFRFMTVGMRDPANLAQVGSIEDRTVPGGAGVVPVRVYRPASDGPHPTVVFFHGGGFVIGDLDTHDDHARLLCRDVDALVVSVDYRLAPETPFPGGYEDCLAVTLWVVEHAAELGSDPARVAVAGDSAGGNLSAAVTLGAREQGVQLAAQLLLYPAVDFVDSEDHPSRAENAEGYFLTEADMRWFGDHYVPDPARRSDPYASVLRAPDLSGLPPAVVATAEYDPLRDEGEAYAAALDKAGVPVTVRRFDGLIHGFFGLPHVSPACAEAVRVLCADLKALLR